MKFIMFPVVLMLEKLIRVLGCLWYNYSKKIVTFLMSHSLSFYCVLNRNKGGFFRLSFLFKFSSLPLHTPTVIINPLQQLNWGVMAQQGCTNIFWVINDCWNAITNQHCCYAYFTTSWICCWFWWFVFWCFFCFVLFYLIILRIHLLQRWGQVAY